LIAYSIGSDEEDNDGKLNRSNPEAKGSDLGFELWDVKRRRQPPGKAAEPSAKK
jgi:hypothetical protein